MRALVATGAEPPIELAHAPEPEPGPDEALVDVRAVSLNRGEVEDLRHTHAGVVPGWDLAGVVARAAASGGGPAAGTRVAGLVRRGAWAEHAAVPIRDLAAIPEALSDAQAAAVPTAALTAARALALGGDLAGKSVLVAGARGGVGRFAVGLARLAGARVTALVRGGVSAEELGAHILVDAIDRDYDVVVDAVGGRLFGAAIEHLRPGGVVVNVATPDPDERVAFRAGAFDRSAGARIVTFDLRAELAAGDGAARELERVLTLVAAGTLASVVGFESSWETAADAIAAFERRSFGGKAVLVVS